MIQILNTVKKIIYLFHALQSSHLSPTLAESHAHARKIIYLATLIIVSTFMFYVGVVAHWVWLNILPSQWGL